MPDPYRESTEEKPEAVKELERMSAAAESKEKPVAPELGSTLPEKTPIVQAQEKVGVQAPPPQAAPPSTPAPRAAPAPSNDLKLADKDRQLKILVDLAFQKGIDEAVKAAQATENAYLIDEFHDTLVDKFRQELMNKGRLKEI